MKKQETDGDLQVREFIYCDDVHAKVPLKKSVMGKRLIAAVILTAILIAAPIGAGAILTSKAETDQNEAEIYDIIEDVQQTILMSAYEQKSWLAGVGTSESQDAEIETENTHTDTGETKSAEIIFNETALEGEDTKTEAIEGIDGFIAPESSEEALSITDFEDNLQILEIFANSNMIDTTPLPSYLVRNNNKDMIMELSEEDYNDLLRIVEAEAPAEDIYGKILVANVVLNRVLSENFSNSVHEVVYECFNGTYQFTPVSIPWYWNSIKVSSSTREAVQRALEGEDYSQGALFFCAYEDCNKTAQRWFTTSTDKLFVHGEHTFWAAKDI